MTITANRPDAMTLRWGTLTPSRPYAMTFRWDTIDATSTRLLTTEEAQRLLDHYTPLTATAARVVLQGDAPDLTYTLTPATRGGGPAFTITR